MSAVTAKISEKLPSAEHVKDVAAQAVDQSKVRADHAVKLGRQQAKILKAELKDPNSPTRLRLEAAAAGASAAATSTGRVLSDGGHAVKDLAVPVALPIAHTAQSAGHGVAETARKTRRLFRLITLPIRIVWKLRKPAIVAGVGYAGYQGYQTYMREREQQQVPMVPPLGGPTL